MHETIQVRKVSLIMFAISILFAEWVFEPSSRPRSDSNTSASAASPVIASGVLPPITTVFIILEENHDWSDITPSAAPYIWDTLIPMGAHANQYFNPPGLHPSEPNYLWLEAGRSFGISNDDDPDVNHQSTVDHLVTYLTRAGISWKSYQEDIPGTNCPLSRTHGYAPKHNPMVFFDDVTEGNNSNSQYCISHVRPYAELASDLRNNTVARYNFITPNLCNDMHDCSVSTGDTWLSREVPKIVASQAYQNGGAIFITWDEGEGDDGPIGMIVVSPLAKRNYSNSIHYTHSSTLRTMQEIFGVTPLLGDAANATDLSDLFTVPTAPIVLLSPSNLDFGNQGVNTTSSPQTVRLSNIGSSALTINGVMLTGPERSDFAQTTSCGSSLAAGATCSLNVTFTPSSTGSRAATLRITNNAKGSPHSVTLMGIGSLAQESGEHAVVNRAATANFVPIPNLPGCVTGAVEHGDPGKGPSVMLSKVRSGCVIPWHWHTPNEDTMAVSGTFQLEAKGERAVLRRAGDYIFLPSHHAHQAKCLGPGSCLLFLYLEGAFDIHYVNKTGQEISPDEALKGPERAMPSKPPAAKKKRSQ